MSTYEITSHSNETKTTNSVSETEAFDFFMTEAKAGNKVSIQCIESDAIGKLDVLLASNRNEYWATYTCSNKEDIFFSLIDGSPLKEALRFFVEHENEIPKQKGLLKNLLAKAVDHYTGEPGIIRLFRSSEPNVKTISSKTDRNLNSLVRRSALLFQYKFPVPSEIQQFLTSYQPRISLTSTERQDIKKLLEQGQETEAIELIRNTLDLNEPAAKELLQELISNMEKDTNDYSFEDEILKLIRSGRKLEAIKITRERRGLDLTSAKQFVENIEQQ